MSLTVQFYRFKCNIVFRLELVQIKWRVEEILGGLGPKMPENAVFQHSAYKKNRFFSFKVL